MGDATVGEVLTSIEVGKKVDLIVLDQNLFDIPVSRIHNPLVIFTMVDGEVRYDAFFGLGDMTAGLRTLGIVQEASEDFDLLVENLLENKPANTAYDEHQSAGNIGTAIYEALKATRGKEK